MDQVFLITYSNNVINALISNTLMPHDKFIQTKIYYMI